MKRCPTCNRTFDEDWLAFCTQDGTSLVDEGPAKRDEPPPTILASPPPPPQGGWQQPSGGLGSEQFQSQPIPPPAPPPGLGAPSSGLGSGPFQPPQQMQSGWQPPPPPTYAQAPAQGMAITSMVCGIFSVTIGWCCYLGVISAPLAIALGAYQLVQIKNHPDQAGGKPMATVGVVLGSVYFVLIGIIILIYGAATLMRGIK
jgi:hypothetical protein